MRTYFYSLLEWKIRPDSNIFFNLSTVNCMKDASKDDNGLFFPIENDRILPEWKRGSPSLWWGHCCRSAMRQLQ